MAWDESGRSAGSMCSDSIEQLKLTAWHWGVQKLSQTHTLPFGGDDKGLEHQISQRYTQFISFFHHNFLVRFTSAQHWGILLERGLWVRNGFSPSLLHREASWWKIDTEDMFSDHGEENSATHMQRSSNELNSREELGFLRWAKTGSCFHPWGTDSIWDHRQAQ